MGEIFRTTGELLVQSFWGIVVPTAVGIWNWIVVGGLWLLIGGMASLPLIVRGAKKLHDRFQHLLARIAIWTGAVLLTWFYAHLWTASALWFARNVLTVPAEEATPDAVLILLFLWLDGWILTLIFR